MTRDELITEAAAIGGWFLDDMQAIRRIGHLGHDECPLTAAANRHAMPHERYETFEWQDAAELLGVDLETARQIADDADIGNVDMALRLGAIQLGA